MQVLEISLDERYIDEARKMGIIENFSEFFNKSLVDYVNRKKREMEKMEILAGVQEAVDDVNHNRVSKIDTLWTSIDD